jgi:hypothetical protein
MTKPQTTIRYGSISHCKYLGHEVVLWGRGERISNFEKLCGGWWECKTCGNEEVATPGVVYG